MSFTEIAVQMASLIAHANGCELESFSLDCVDTYVNEDGEQETRVRVSATLAPPRDEIPFEITPRPAAEPAKHTPRVPAPA